MEQEAGFENLIAELTNEFRKLRRRVADLEAKKSQLLPKADDSNEHSRPTSAEGWEPSKDRSVVSSADFTADRSRGGCLASQLGSDRILCRGRVGGAPGSSTFAQDIARAAPKLPTFHSEASLVGGAVCKEASLRSLSKDVSAVEVRRNIRTAISEMLGHNALFDTLDHAKRGKLTVQDLATVIEEAGQDVEDVELTSIVRILNGLEAVEAHDCESMQTCGALGVDFAAFHRMMDPELELGERYDDALAAIRQACQLQGKQGGGRYKSRRSLLLTIPASGEDAKHAVESTFRRWVPTLLESLPPIVILLNALMVGLAVDLPQHEAVWDGCEYAFVAFYTAEFLLKTLFGGCKAYFRGPDCLWNWFDFVCLMISLVEVAFKVSTVLLQAQTTSGSEAFLPLKFLRLSRLVRLVRMLRFKIFAELKLMVMGVVHGLRVLGWAIVLLLILVYLVGVVTKSIIGDAEPEFKDMTSSMFTLFRCWTEGCMSYDGKPLSEILRQKYGNGWAIFHVLMTMFVAIGLFNLIMAIFIDNVVNSQLLRKHVDMVERSSEVEHKFKHLFASFIKNGTDSKLPRDSAFLRKLHRVTKMHNKVWDGAVDWSLVDKEWEVLREMDISVTKEVFSDWLATPELDELLDEAEIYVTSRSELFDVLDVDMGGQLSMDELTTGLMKLRGSPTKADIVAVRLKVRYFTGILEGLIERQSEMVHNIRAQSIKPPGMSSLEDSMVLGAF